jgi:nucleoside-diphosphate-sugar epimerase
VGGRIVNLGGDEVVTIEEIIRYLEQLTGLEMRFEEADRAAWETQVLDPTLRRELAGPCGVTWRDGVRRSLAERFPGGVAE